MGAPKQKWTPEEEAALRAGVEKYGPGKWRAIQKDPEFGPCLVTRSNVDLKDKWRNMNVGSSGHGSRDKSLKAISRHISGKDESSPAPLAVAPADYSADDTHGVVDTLVSSDSSKDRKTLGPRYTELVMNAIHESKDANGCSTAAIATFIEAHHSVPSNFRRLLSSKLREMVNQGNLIKSRQNFKVNVADPASKAGARLLQDGEEGNQSAEIYRDGGKRMRGHVKGNGLESPTLRPLSDVSDAKQAFRSTRSHMKKLRGESGMRKARLDVDFAKSKLKTAEEAARAAALAVAEAEAAAAAAEKAAKEAEAAEAEAEAAEIAAEIAALAARPPKKVRSAGLPAEEVAVAV